MSRFAHGTLAHQLIYRRTPRAHAAYLHFKPIQPATEAQQNHHILFARLADRWSHLEHPAREYWNPQANALRITPYNAYLQYNLHRLNPAQPENLIGWWPNLVPAGDTLHDLSGYLKDGELVNLNPDNAWVHSPNRRGKVINYDGIGYVNVPEPPSATETYTWAFWFKQNAYTNQSCIVDTGFALRYQQALFLSSKIHHWVRDKAAQSDPTWQTDFAWHHYCGTYHLNSISLYIDNQLSQSTPQPTDPEPQLKMTFAAWLNEMPAYHFSGQVDDLRFYNRKLEASQRQQLADW